MIILGDIGNTETKICLVKDNKIIKKILLPSKGKKIHFLNKGFKGFDLIIDDGSHLLSDIIYSLNFFFKYLNYKGIYVIEDYKFPNYFKRNKDCDELLVDQILVNLKEKKHFLSKVINQDNQRYLFKSIKSIKYYTILMAHMEYDE